MNQVLQLISEHTTISIAAVLTTFIATILLLFLLIKKKSKKANISKETTKQNIKNIKKQVSKKKYSPEQTSFYIFYGSNDAAKDFLAKANNQQAEIIELNDSIHISITENRLALLCDYNSIPLAKKIAKKINISLKEINICLNANGYNSYEEGQIKTLAYGEYKLKAKNIILSFYFGDGYSSLNKTLATNNTIKLTKNIDTDCNSINQLINNNLIKPSEIYQKLEYTKALNSISKLLKIIYADINSTDKNFYLFLKANSFNKVYIKNSLNPLKLNTPKTLIFTLISTVLSVTFLTNIFQQLNNRNNDTPHSYKNNIKDLITQEKQQKNNINNTIYLNFLYPENIKYSKINTSFADIEAKEILFKKFTETKDLSSFVAYLAFFTYMKDDTIDENTKEIISIISNFTKLPTKQLENIINYASDDIKDDVYNNASHLAELSYERDSINIDLDTKNFLSTKGFNLEYLGISDSARAKAINEIYTKSTHRCTIDKIIPEIEQNYIIPSSFNNIYSMYKHHFKENQKGVCNSTFIEAVSKNIKIVLDNSDDEYNSFNSLIKSMKHTIESIENNNQNIAYNNQETLQKITKSLISYELNNIVENNYQNTDFPLTTPVSKDLFMKLHANFYDTTVSISPIYSKTYIYDNIIDLNSSFKQLINELKNDYDISPAFLYSIYKNSLERYERNYIKAYDNIIAKLDDDKSIEQKINTKEKLDTYLSAMSSKDSSFNNILNFYRKNTNLTSDDDTQTTIFTNIDKHFREENKFLNSESFIEYQELFNKISQLIKEQGYSKAYETLNNDYKPLQEVYSNLATINNPHNNSLYRLLKEQLSVALKSLQTIVTEDAINKLNNEIGAQHSRLNESFPLNKNSDVTLSDEEITQQLSKSGMIYNAMMKNLKPLLIYNKYSDSWNNRHLTTKKEKHFVNYFNKVYQLNQLLWQKDSQPKPLIFKIQPIENKNQDYTFYSLIINKDTFVNSLNVNYQEDTKIEYQWNLAESTKIIAKLPNGNIAEKSYNGDWALLKAIKDADCNSDGVCTWKLNFNNKTYPVSFKITGKFLTTLNWPTKES